jgi:hypothetical protein
MLALDALCEKLGVKIVPSSVGSPCFLGRGSCGRVFRVRDADDNVNALKVAIRDQVSKIEKEYSNYQEKNLLSSGVIVTCKNHYVDPAKQFAGILLYPVGRPMKETRKDVKAALMSLKKLNSCGLQHRDSRKPNAVFVKENGVDRCLWIDFQTLHPPRPRLLEEAFVTDVCTLINSFDISVDEDLRGHITAYYREGPDKRELLDKLLAGVSTIWRSRKVEIDGL